MAIQQKNSDRWVIGIDEVGRGPLAGPVTVCAVAIPKKKWSAFSTSAKRKGLTDSKQLSVSQRAVWSKTILTAQKEGDIRIAVVSASATQIDKKGIAVVIKNLVARTLSKLDVDPVCAEVYLDGSLYAPAQYTKQKTIIKGDASHMAIAAASVVAKVHRDAVMLKQHKRYPEYGFADHKGYGTKQHRSAISSHGLCPLHRRSFCGRIDIA